MMRALKPFTLVTAIMAFATATSAQAAYEVDIQQVGSNVVASGSGSINLDALTFATSFSPAFSQVEPSEGLVLVGSGAYSIYKGFSGPASFGSGALTFADSSTGGVVFIWAANNELGVPDGYSSGATISPSTAIFDNSTLASLGLTPGTYIWSWGSGPSADSFTVQIRNAAAVPEPSTWLMMLGGFAGAGITLRRRHARRRELVAAT